MFHLRLTEKINDDLTQTCTTGFQINMDGALLRKNVIFLGMWRSVRLDDDLTREIANKARTIHGRMAHLEIRTVGARLYTRNGTQDSVIRMPDVRDISVNRHDPECLLCVLKEGRHLNVIVCRCYNSRDPSDIVKSFRASKKDDTIIVNEIKTKHNWSLQPRHDRARLLPEQIFGDEKRNLPVFEKSHVGIQVNPGEYDNVSLSISSIPSNDLRKELSQLSEEVKAIKILLEKSTVVRGEDKPVHEIQQTDAKVPVKEISKNKTQHINAKIAVSIRERKPPTFIKGDFVSANSPGYYPDDAMDADVDSGQDMHDGHGSIVKTPNVRGLFVTDSLFTDDKNHRLSGKNYGGQSRDDYEEENPPSFSRNTRLSTYITAPPDLQPETAPVRTRTNTTPSRRYNRQSHAVLSSTIPRSIENVYPSSTRFVKSTNRRSRQVLSPETFVADGVRRPRSSSAHDPARGRMINEDLELRRSLYKLYNEA